MKTKVIKLMVVIWTMALVIFMVSCNQTSKTTAIEHVAIIAEVENEENILEMQKQYERSIYQSIAEVENEQNIIDMQKEYERSHYRTIAEVENEQNINEMQEQYELSHS